MNLIIKKCRPTSTTLTLFLQENSMDSLRVIIRNFSENPGIYLQRQLLPLRRPETQCRPSKSVPSEINWSD